MTKSCDNTAARLASLEEEVQGLRQLLARVHIVGSALQLNTRVLIVRGQYCGDSGVVIHATRCFVTIRRRDGVLIRKRKENVVAL